MCRQCSWMIVLVHSCAWECLQAVHAVNMTHDSAHAQMDVKFRSLVCCGLKLVVLSSSLLLLMGVNSLPMTVTRQRHHCDFNPGPSVSESSTLTTWLPSHPVFRLVSCRLHYYRALLLTIEWFYRHNATLVWVLAMAVCLSVCMSVCHRFRSLVCCELNFVVVVVIIITEHVGLLPSVNSRLVWPFWYRLTRVFLDKGPLNVCVCVLLP